METKSKVIEALKNANTVAIYIHINVDCDAMGSALALRSVLTGLGKSVDVFVNSNFPNNFGFFGDLGFVNKRSITGKCDLAVCLDTANENRIGKFKFTYKKNSKSTLLIDHHDVSSTPFCKLNYVLHSSSTAEILFYLFKEMGVQFSPDICKFLLAGIITDTGKFMHSVSPETMFAAGELIRLGSLNIEEITMPLLNSMTPQVFSMLQSAYENIEFYSDSKLGIIMFKREDFERTHTTTDDLDAFPDIPLQLEATQFAILASEDDKGYFRVSMRSKGNVSAQSVAEVFGGGGHKNASGCKIFGDYAEVKEKLIQATLDVLGWKR